MNYDDSTADVMPLSIATQDRVVLRLRRSGSDDAHWVTELVCFLFNAQGEVLQVARGVPPPPTTDSSTSTSTSSHSGDFFGPAGNLVMRRQRAKDAVEKELLAFALPSLHTFVEAVGCLVTYAEDEIARSPRLNAFAATCDVCSSDSDMDSSPISSSNVTSDSVVRAFEYVHDPRSAAATAIAAAGPVRNVVVLCKLYRNRLNRGEWLLHAIGSPTTVRSAITAALAEAMQVWLLDIMPELEIPHRNALTSVAAVCAALDFAEFRTIERAFPAGADGIEKDDFARVVLLALLPARPDLAASAARASALVALLCEMFEQIDINGDAVVDWEEFTTFCMSLGLIATSAHRFGGAALRAMTSFPYQISTIKSFAQLKRIAVVENKSAVVLMYDSDLVLHHEMTGVEKLASKATAAVAVLDVDHIVARNVLAIASSDHTITLWSIVNAATGAYVLARKITTRFPVVLLKWVGPLRRLLAVSGADDAQLWDIDTQRVDARLRHHRDRISDVIELGGTGLFATSSFDHTIAVWDAATQTVAFTLEGHAQGVLTLDYAHATLLSSGFEYQALCWSIANRALLVTLSGHQHRLIGAKFVSSRASAASVVSAVTGDESGHFKLWDVSRCVQGSASEPATVLQSFELLTPTVCRFRAFACPVAGAGGTTVKSNESELADIVVGNLRLFRFRAVTQAEESAPPRHVVYNAVANTFVGAVDGTITVWNGSSGAKVEEPLHIRDVDVCGIVFDVPRERKLFVATSDGCIRLYNPITGLLMTKSQIHDGAISSLIFCPRTCCLITTGYDRNICISHSTAGKTDVEVLRTVENAHDASITACAYSAELDLVATGDDAGNVHVYDFAKLYLLFRCAGHHHEVRALHFHVQAPLLVSGDASGVVFLWPITGVAYTAVPLMRLTLQSSTTPTTLSPSLSTVSDTKLLNDTKLLHSNNNLSPVTSICSTPERAYAAAKPLILVACESGDVVGYDFRVVASVARKRQDTRPHFAYRNEPLGDAIATASPLLAPMQQQPASGYNPLLRVAHKQSVLRLHPEDRSGGAAALAMRQSIGTDTLVCVATLTWRAHNDAVLALKVVPDPGLVFTCAMDSTIRVWDAAYECIGTISTLDSAGKRRPPQLHPQQQSPGRTQQTTVSATASTPAGEPSQDGTTAWKFTRHASADATERHTRIATDVLRKFARRKQKALRRAQKAASRAKPTGGASGDADNVGDTMEAQAAAASRRLSVPQLPLQSTAKRKPTGIDALVTSPLPFSNESVRAGVQQGLFGPRESQQLKDLAGSATAIAAAASTTALAPLLLSSDELIAAARQRLSNSSNSSSTDCWDLAMMRTMHNFPLEVQRRTGTTRSHAIQALDVAPSPFLLEKLSEERHVRASGSGAKSTPKKRPMWVGASGVVPRNVSLPKLPEAHVVAAGGSNVRPAFTLSDGGTSSSSGLATDALHTEQLLSTSASAPALSTSSSVDETADSQSQLLLDDAAKRSNIARKLKLYDDIVAASATHDSSSDKSSDKHPAKRFSQPSIPVWKMAAASAASAADAATANGAASPAKRKSSHGTLSSSMPNANPFGPYYTAKQVLEFATVLTRFDDDFSGDLDQNEWQRMLQSCRPLFGPADHDATEQLFRSLDTDDSGRISLHEILSALFSKATPEQLQKMKKLLRRHTNASEPNKAPT